VTSSDLSADFKATGMTRLPQWLHNLNFMQALFLKADILVNIFLFFAGRDVKLKSTDTREQHIKNMKPNKINDT